VDASTTAMEAVAGIDLTGRTALVTGVSAGLGVETTRALRSAGARVVGAARDLDKARSALAGIDGVELVELDLADLGSVRKAADHVGSSYDGLDLLLNNAGVMAPPLMRTAQGFELQLGTNHLGHFALTTALLPLLRPGARIVNVSSRGHLRSGMRWDDPHFRDESSYDKWIAYGQSKTANVLFAVELEKRLAPQGVHAYALHPGVIMTELSRHLTAEDLSGLGKQVQARRTGMSMKTVEQGAATTVYAATSPELEGRGGLYLEDCHVAEPTPGDGSAGYAPWAVDPDQAARLWDWSLEQTA
jgi:NAD(P)-dependent dehydrogenase (short-subunit alcohol dehydrogenase family)